MEFCKGHMAYACIKEHDHNLGKCKFGSYLFCSDMDKEIFRYMEYVKSSPLIFGEFTSSPSEILGNLNIETQHQFPEPMFVIKFEMPYKKPQIKEGVGQDIASNAHIILDGLHSLAQAGTYNLDMQAKRNALKATQELIFTLVTHICENDLPQTELSFFTQEREMLENRKVKLESNIEEIRSSINGKLEFTVDKLRAINFLNARDPMNDDR